MIRNAKYGDDPQTAEQVAFAAMKAQAAIGSKVLDDLAADAKNSGAAGVKGTPASTGEPKAKSEDEQAAELLVNAIPANLKKEDK